MFVVRYSVMLAGTKKVSRVEVAKREQAVELVTALAHTCDMVKMERKETENVQV